MASTLSLFTGNLLSPPVLSFAFGLTAVFLRSDLRIPTQIYKAMTIYLLFAIGLKGGILLDPAQWQSWALPCLMVLVLGSLIPLVVYPICRKALNLNRLDAASMGAHYGSVSAVTFIAGQAYLQGAGIHYEGYLTALLATMEIPAILIALTLAKVRDPSSEVPIGKTMGEIARSSSVFLLIAGLVVGVASGPESLEKVKPFFIEPFYGVLVLFLLELGLVAGSQLKEIKSFKGLFIFSLLFPLVMGPIGIVASSAVGLSQGGAVLVAILCGSASYIAAPAATRMALPEANPATTVTAALGLTFPFNLCLGIPYFAMLAQWWYQVS